MFKFECALIFLIISCYSVFACSYNHLPLSDNLARTFPHLNATCFVIVNEETNIIVHEKNSRYAIKFDDVQKSSLHELALNNNDLRAESEVSGKTFVYQYKNHYGHNFKMALSGINTKLQFERDKNNINHWLDQFFLTKICYKNELLAKIPVIYSSDTKNVEMIMNKDLSVILSDKKSNKVIKTILYKSVIAGPFDKDTCLGSLNISTDTFAGQITTDIYSTRSAKKGKKLKNTIDSIRYLIFGPTF